MIFDEVVTGYRWALGGGAEYFGVRPDLATFGKAMANGWPLAALLGPRDVMEAGGRLVSSTHGGEVISIIMGLSVLDTYQARPVIREMWAAGEALIAGFNAAALAAGVAYRMAGYPCKPYIEGCDALLLQEAATRGVLLHPTSLNVSASHVPAIVERSVACLADALQAIAAGATLRGLPCRPVFQRVPG